MGSGIQYTELTALVQSARQVPHPRRELLVRRARAMIEVGSDASCRSAPPMSREGGPPDFARQGARRFRWIGPSVTRSARQVPHPRRQLVIGRVRVNDLVSGDA